MIETTLRATSEKLWPCGVQDFRRPAQLVGAVCGEVALDRGAAFGAFAGRRGCSPPPARVALARARVQACGEGQGWGTGGTVIVSTWLA